MPRYGLIETRIRALDDPRAMVALWMIGLEDEPERSGEILVAEIFGRDVQSDRARIGMGVRRWADPALTDDVVAEDVAVDVRDWHAYSADWTQQHVAFYVDDRLVRVVEQSPDYPLQLMLAHYEFPVDDDHRRPTDYPKVFEVDWVRISQRRA
jgi:beta-glucanase (GH16 family)